MSKTTSSLVVVRRPEVRFDTEEDLRTFCGRASERIDTTTLDIELAITQFRAAMGQIPDGTGLGVTSKVRARLVMGHLKACAKVLDLASGYCGGAWLSYCKQYSNERTGS
jgi:hypothetical protein